MADTFRVTDIRQSFGTVGNRLVPVVVVSYETVAGTTGEVEIPKSQFSAETARAVIEAEVAEQLKLLSPGA
jgi:hypothetical protein